MGALLSVSCLALRGYRQGCLRDDDVLELPVFSGEASRLVTAARARWQIEKLRLPQPKPWRVVWAAVRCYFIVGVLCVTLRGISNAFLMPMILRELVDAVVIQDESWAWTCLGMLVAERIFANTVEYAGNRLLTGKVAGMTVVTLSGLVMDKTSTPIRGLDKADVQPTAFQARELTMIYMMLGQIGSSFSALPTLIAGALTLVLLLGWPAIFGIAWIGCTIMLGMSAAKRSKVLEGRTSSIATERLNILTNIIGAIKAIKYFTWEPEFLEELNASRRREIEFLRRTTRLNALSTTLGKLTPVTAALVTFVLYSLSGHEMRASEIFACNSVFMTIRFAVGASSMLVRSVLIVSLTFARATKLLVLPECQPRASRPEEAETDSAELAAMTNLAVDFTPAQSDGKPSAGSAPVTPSFSLKSLGRVSLVQRGQLTAVCGAVGSGKTTLLTALLNAVDGDPAVSGEIELASTKGWCPQRAFIISATILDNIVMGRGFDEVLLQNCIRDASLERDLELLQGGLDEVVGERGTTLSGGQQARVSLARAFYGEPALLLLDDPLAAVDATVGRQILQALRARCTRPRSSSGKPPGAFVVINQLHLLKNFDRIVFVREGVVVAHGSLEDLSQCPAFVEFTSGIEMDPALDFKDVGAAANQDGKLIGKFRSNNSVEDSQSLKDGTRANHSIVVTGVQKETLQLGLVSRFILQSYLAAAGACFMTFLVFSFICTYASLGMRDWWLSVWSDDTYGSSKGVYVGMFIIISLLHIFGAILGILLMGTFAARVGQHLHSECAYHLLRAPMSYFDMTPSGRITSRFGADLGAMDSQMPLQVDFTMTFGFTLTMMCIVVIIKVPWMLMLMAIVLVAYYPAFRGLIVFQQDVKRQSNSSISPILSNLTEMQRGAALVNVLGCQQFFMERHVQACNAWTKLVDASIMATPVTMFWCNIMGVIFVSAVGWLTLKDIETFEDSPGIVGMYLSYSVLFGLFAGFVSLVVMGLLGNLTSLERLFEYRQTDFNQEAPWSLPGDPKPQAWPTAGEVSFSHVSLRYRPDLPLALDSFNLQIHGGEKLGIVGRTGAGKSSITSILFRLVPCEAGKVLIDGVDILELGVHTLRRAISMIPQEPIVMSGSVRYNLDPFGKEQDDALLKALEVVGLHQTVSLDTPAGGSGAGLSAGQRQLLTFSRTLLQTSRIVVMDEPTASVDMQTDRLVQSAARSQFQDRTVIIIAHRLDTVRECNRIAVMDRGQLAEIGPPSELLSDPASRLSQLHGGAPSSSPDSENKCVSV